MTSSSSFADDVIELQGEEFNVQQRKRKKKTSKAWEDFVVIDLPNNIQKAQCKHCSEMLAYKSGNPTSPYLNHGKTCRRKKIALQNQQFGPPVKMEIAPDGNSRQTKCIGVVGGGQMGSGIAQLAAVNGIDVWLHDTDAGALTRAVSSISDSIQRFVSEGQLSQQVKTEAMRCLKCTRNLEDLASADIVVEAIVESEEVKKNLFNNLDKIVKKSAILASNTSSISITRLAAATSRPHQVIGMHFMNPPPIMKLVEIVRGADTSESTFNVTKALAERFGKTVICSQDYPGFIVNRILMPMINEAFHALYSGVATKEDIDTGMKLGTNHPMGPLELADFIGLDVCVSIMKVLHEGLGDTRYVPCPLLVRLVDAGHLGRKRGIGVYNYKKSSKETEPSLPRL